MRRTFELNEHVLALEALVQEADQTIAFLHESYAEIEHRLAGSYGNYENYRQLIKAKDRARRDIADAMSHRQTCVLLWAVALWNTLHPQEEEDSMPNELA